MGSTTPTTLLLTQSPIGHYRSVAGCPALPGGQGELEGQSRVLLDAKMKTKVWVKRGARKEQLWSGHL